MSKRTKKVGNTGWMGARYGIRIRRRVLDIDAGKRQRSPCPKCATVTLVRVASGVYECRRCGQRFASGAYQFSPPSPVTVTERSTVSAPGAPPMR